MILNEDKISTDIKKSCFSLFGIFFLLLGRLKRENRASSLVVLKQVDINFSISLTRREGNVHVLN